MNTFDYDYLIIGSGVAGLSVALNAARNNQRVLLVTKAHLEESNTRYAQGGIAAAVAHDDTTTSHRDDTLIAGAGLCDAAAVEVLTADAPERIQELIELGVAFDREVSGELELGREGAHSANRILHAGGDATGYHIEHGLAGAVRRSPNVEILEEHFATELLLENNRVIGVNLLAPDKTSFAVRSLFTVLATGGAGQLFRYTTNPLVTTGDGLALAYRAGAALADLEFFQFHPTALSLPGVPTFLISEAVRGDGAILRNSSGYAFMKDYDGRGELASRDIVSRAIATEMLKTNAPVYLDATGLGEAVVRHRFPGIYQFCQQYGLDIARQLIPVSPAAHYYMGGILTGLNGETTLPGLFACGEAACTGVHGANRLASNSLLEGLVFGRRLYEYTRQADPAPYVPTENGEFLSMPALSEEVTVNRGVPTRLELQNLMWEKVGLAREASGLAEAVRQLSQWEKALAQLETSDLAQLELHNLVTVGLQMARAALLREESRGAHYRTDFPNLNPAWVRRILIQDFSAKIKRTERAVLALI